MMNGSAAATPYRRLSRPYRDAVPEAQLRSRAGAILKAAPGLEAPFERTEIPGGDYAVLRFKGPYADTKAADQWLYGDWLTGSGHEAVDAPCFENYLNNPREVKPNDLMTDIHLPLK